MNSSKCCMLGKNRQTSYLPKKSTEKNTITGVTIIPVSYTHLATKREAQEWERMFKLQTSSDLDMSFEAFTELYINDVKNRDVYKRQLHGLCQHR